MTFTLELEELPFVVDGFAFTAVDGSAEVSRSGDVVSITIQSPWSKNGVQTLTENNKDAWVSELFKRLAACIRSHYAAQIMEEMEDIYRSRRVREYA